MQAGSLARGVPGLLGDLAERLVELLVVDLVEQLAQLLRLVSDTDFISDTEVRTVSVSHAR